MEINLKNENAVHNMQYIHLKNMDTHNNPDPNTNTNTNTRGVVMSYIIAFYNIANAALDDKMCPFAKRLPRVIEKIRHANPSVIGLSELRTCSPLNPDEVPGRRMTPEEIAQTIARATNLEIGALYPQNPDDMAFWRSTLHDTHSLIPLQRVCRYAIPYVSGENSPRARGVMFIFSQFATIEAPHHRFWVINSHMPLDTGMKLECVRWLNANAVKTCAELGDPDPIIIYGGDQNTFFDKPGDGDAMMQEFANAWTHLTPNIGITFVSFPYDKIQTKSTLDHIFVNIAAVNRIRAEPFVVPDPDQSASDHLLIGVRISFN